jgi:AraC family transcriptional regulator of adaptative response/methylated-DNA-[protein]-cysteine methyltransferase
MGRVSFYGVTTTGIFCRFGCPSRTPTPDNVVFFDTVKDATEQGFRACKRCRPDQEVSPHEAFGAFVVTQVIAVAQATPQSRIEDIARGLALSKRQLERIIKATTGLSPRQYIHSALQAPE